MNIKSWEQLQILKAGALGGAASLSLALQLADAVPCEHCNYIKQHCKCDNENLTGFILGAN